MFLSGYNYTLKYKTGTSSNNADHHSQFPKDCENDFYKLENVVFLTDLVESPVTSLDIKNESFKGPVISRVIDYVQFGWSTEKKLDLAFDPYENRKVELNIDQGCLIWENRVIIPKMLQLNVLKSLHEAHPVMSRMKSLARLYFCWVKWTETLKKELKLVNPTKNIKQCLSKHHFIHGNVEITKG